MWTPRRILLLLVGVAVCVVSYLGYAVAFGSVDGLPVLAEKYKHVADGQIVIQNPSVQPLSIMLAQAFGQESPEVIDKATYKERFEFREKGMLIACGAPEMNGTEQVIVSPLSVALRGKSKTGKPGEIIEISTFHADRAILRFDRKINSFQDFQDKAKIREIELEPDPEYPSPEEFQLKHVDPRRGNIWITNNQKSLLDDHKIVIRTSGRVFFRVPDDSVANDPNVAHIWTAAAVEMVDRRNLPLTMRHEFENARTAPARPDDLRRRGAIGEILLDEGRPPPTVVANGMKIYLKQNEINGKKTWSGNVTIRELHLLEQVQLNIWNDGESAKLSGEPSQQDPNAKPVAPAPPFGMVALMGTSVGGVAIAEQVKKKSLMMIDTPGSFRYDFDTSIARFDIAGQQTSLDRPNFVTVTRIDAAGMQDNLYCNVLTLEFETEADKAAVAPAVKPTTDKPGAPTDSFALKRMIATGPKVYVSIDAESFAAEGQELRYEKKPKEFMTKTTLMGTPVAVERHGSRMMGGDRATPGIVEMLSIEPRPGSKEERTSTVTVRGPGAIDVFDAEQKKVTARATWGKSLVHEKTIVNKRPQELLKFEGGGAFVDNDGDFRLSADKIWLWIAERKDEKNDKAAKNTPALTSGTVPERLEADGNVDARSPDMVIRRTDKFAVTFIDIPPPKVAVAPKPKDPMVPVKPMVVDPKNPNPMAVKEPEKEVPNPIFISAEVVRATMGRYPAPVDLKKAAEPVPAGQKRDPSMKYEMQSALCEGKVNVEQAPDLKENPEALIGLRILGKKLNIDQSALGSVLRVFGSEEDPASVEFETSKLLGPNIHVDQPNNTVHVQGRGTLKLKSSFDQAGNDSARPSDLVVTWAREMKFDGAKSNAEFVHNVSAMQVTQPDPPLANLPKIAANVNPNGEPIPAPKPLGEPNPYLTRTTLQCFRLDLTFDKPIYFNQLQRDGKKQKQTKAEERPKIRTAVCSPVPSDEIALYGNNAQRDVYFVEEVFDIPDATKPNAKYIRARRLRAQQIDVNMKEKVQELSASGGGELRMLQGDDSSNDGAFPGANDKPAPKTDKPKDGEMTLTIVTFPTRMFAEDKGKLFQSAKFDGARVARVPADNGIGTQVGLNLPVEWHQLPKKSVRLECSESLVVSSSKLKPESKPQQSMEATGNAGFQNDSYVGDGGKITYDGQQIVLIGTENRLAHLEGRDNKSASRSSHQAEMIIYKRDGSISVKRSGGGSISPK